ncbi:MAG: tagaturonate reductase, partial [Ginsengibacter sp.]
MSSAISRVLTAKTDWNKILQCAKKPEMKVVISNTTEVGIQTAKEDIKQSPPSSFPAKLLAFLYTRYQHFGNSKDKSMVIVPTELITNNGEKLAAIILELARFNNLEPTFIQWLKECNHFCNSLVDRIVPGKPDEPLLTQINKELGYTDELLCIAEPYCLWAIEGNEYIKSVLSFSNADHNIIIKKNIDRYRELKLRLLNGTHTLLCGLAYLSNFKTVSQAMNNNFFAGFAKKLMTEEIANAMPLDISPDEARQFALTVLDRFKNESIEHKWIGITMHYTSKMKIRNIPVLLKHYQTNAYVPEGFAWGFAAYLLFMKATTVEGTEYYGTLNSKQSPIKDERAPLFYDLWT